MSWLDDMMGRILTVNSEPDPTVTGDHRVYWHEPTPTEDMVVGRWERETPLWCETLLGYPLEHEAWQLALKEKDLAVTVARRYAVMIPDPAEYYGHHYNLGPWT